METVSRYFARCSSLRSNLIDVNKALVNRRSGGDAGSSGWQGHRLGRWQARECWSGRIRMQDMRWPRAVWKLFLQMDSVGTSRVQVGPTQLDGPALV
jgi:hypothetical protein